MASPEIRKGHQCGVFVLPSEVVKIPSKISNPEAQKCSSLKAIVNLFFVQSELFQQPREVKEAHPKFNAFVLILEPLQAGGRQLNSYLFLFIYITYLLGRDSFSSSHGWTPFLLPSLLNLFTPIYVLPFLFLPICNNGKTGKTLQASQAL